MNVIDTENGVVLPDMVVRLRAGVVASVESKGKVAMEELGKDKEIVVDATGLFMCPGLIDCEYAWKEDDTDTTQATRTSRRRRAGRRRPSKAPARRTRRSRQLT